MRLTLLLILSFLLPLPTYGADWPGWRGPGGTGVSPEMDLPVRWSATENLRWKVAVPGAGVSAPAVWGDRIFLTSSDGRHNDRLHLFCFRREDGKQLWHVRLFGSAQPEGEFPPGGMAVPTPATDGERVYALFGTGDLACLDRDGRPVWIRSLAREYGPFRNRWGMAASPILGAGLLLVQVDHFGPSYLLGIDPLTGKDRWRTPRDTTVNWTSPLVIRRGGQDQVIAVGTEKLTAYAVADGKERWSLPGMQVQCIVTPLACEGLLFVGAGFNFHTFALRLDGKDPGDLPEVAWKARTPGGNIASPVCVGGYYYYAEDSTWCTCLKASTGEQVWRQRLGRQFRASPVAGAGKVFFTSTDGLVTVVKVGPKFERLARNDLGEAVVASPALSQGRIYLRGETHLFCIGE